MTTFTGKYLRQSLQSLQTVAQVFPCEFYQVSKNTFFTEYLLTTVSKPVTQENRDSETISRYLYLLLRLVFQPAKFFEYPLISPLHQETWNISLTALNTKNAVSPVHLIFQFLIILIIFYSLIFHIR